MHPLCRLDSDSLLFLGACLSTLGVLEFIPRPVVCTLPISLPQSGRPRTLRGMVLRKARTTLALKAGITVHPTTQSAMGELRRRRTKLTTVIPKRTPPMQKAGEAHPTLVRTLFPTLVGTPLTMVPTCLPSLPT